MDDADRAQRLEEQQRESALAARGAPAETPRTHHGARVCLGCDERIEAPRLAANPQAVRCTECQRRHEKEK